ncbi:hypothetical protein GJ744_000515 [Endocarpon pusillum]|uniref:Uncharacterized protein n=1 Tax=Endocarpon pusillum TaxID=364733 RepID=A0A8H7AEJ6_9EURO|nr:hypothetical protein GJ744_000515 [Endocarpon pusillum]
MVWGYIQSRETARRMDAYAGEATSMHPLFAFDSTFRAKDMNLATTNAYAGPNISLQVFGTVLRLCLWSLESHLSRAY